MQYTLAEYPVRCTADILGRYSSDGTLEVSVEELYNLCRVTSPGAQGPSKHATQLAAERGPAQPPVIASGTDNGPHLPATHQPHSPAAPPAPPTQHTAPPTPSLAMQSTPGTATQSVDKNGTWTALYALLQAKKKAYTPTSEGKNMSRGAVKPRPGARRAALGPLLSLLREEEGLAQ